MNFTVFPCCLLLAQKSPVPCIHLLHNIFGYFPLFMALASVVFFCLIRGQLFPPFVSFVVKGMRPSPQKDIVLQWLINVRIKCSFQSLYPVLLLYYCFQIFVFLDVWRKRNLRGLRGIRKGLKLAYVILRMLRNVSMRISLSNSCFLYEEGNDTIVVSIVS